MVVCEESIELLYDGIIDVFKKKTDMFPKDSYKYRCCKKTYELLKRMSKQFEAFKELFEHYPEGTEHYFIWLVSFVEQNMSLLGIEFDEHDSKRLTWVFDFGGCRGYKKEGNERIEKGNLEYNTFSYLRNMAKKEMAWQRGNVNTMCKISSDDDVFDTEKTDMPDDVVCVHCHSCETTFYVSADNKGKVFYCPFCGIEFDRIDTYR